MAINLDDRYPGRATPKNLDYPQGSFKNRTAPDSADGTYLEQDWANDQLAFFQSLMKAAGITANGIVDTTQESQYFDALIQTLRGIHASITEFGVAKLATTVQAQSLIDDSVVLTPKTLGAVGATTTTRGITSFATAPEADAGIINNKAITPEIYARNATQEASGILRFATSGEMLGFMRPDIAASPLTVSDAILATSIGLGQSYQNVLSSRVRNTNYTNTTGRPIFVAVVVPDVIQQSTTGQYIQAEVDGVAVAKQILEHPGSEVGGGWVGFIVPPNSFYKITLTTPNNPTNAISSWTELR